MKQSAVRVLEVRADVAPPKLPINTKRDVEPVPLNHVERIGNL